MKWYTDLKKWRIENGYITPEWEEYAEANRKQNIFKLITYILLGASIALLR